MQPLKWAVQVRFLSNCNNVTHIENLKWDSPGACLDCNRYQQEGYWKLLCSSATVGSYTGKEKWRQKTILDENSLFWAKCRYRFHPFKYGKLTPGVVIMGLSFSSDVNVRKTLAPSLVLNTFFGNILEILLPPWSSSAWRSQIHLLAPTFAGRAEISYYLCLCIKHSLLWLSIMMA